MIAKFSAATHWSIIPNCVFGLIYTKMICSTDGLTEGKAAASDEVVNRRTNDPRRDTHRRAMKIDLMNLWSEAAGKLTFAMRCHSNKCTEMTERYLVPLVFQRADQEQARQLHSSAPFSGSESHSPLDHPKSERTSERTKSEG
jgi:hypothetical protein